MPYLLDIQNFISQATQGIFGNIDATDILEIMPLLKQMIRMGSYF